MGRTRSACVCRRDWIGGALDRNGLRPARYAVTEDGLLVMGSEAGLVQVEEELVIKRTSWSRRNDRNQFKREKTLL